MGQLRRRAKQCQELGEWYADDAGVPAVDDDGRHAERIQVGLVLFREMIGKSLRVIEDYLNEMPRILDVFGLETALDHTSFHN